MREKRGKPEFDFVGFSYWEARYPQPISLTSGFWRCEKTEQGFLIIEVENGNTMSYRYVRVKVCWRIYSVISVSGCMVRCCFWGCVQLCTRPFVSFFWGSCRTLGLTLLRDRLAGWIFFMKWWMKEFCFRYSISLEEQRRIGRNLPTDCAADYGWSLGFMGYFPWCLWYLPDHCWGGWREDPHKHPDCAIWAVWLFASSFLFGHVFLSLCLWANTCRQRLEECHSDLVSEVQRERVLQKTILLGLCDFTYSVPNLVKR